MHKAFILWPTIIGHMSTCIIVSVIMLLRPSYALY